MLALRVLIAALAVVVIGWFALGYVQTHSENQATALLAAPGTPSHAVTAEIISLLDRAGTLNPDRAIDLYRVEALVRAGDNRAGERISRVVTRAEPQNIDAWLALGFAAPSGGSAAGSLARAQEGKLAPPVPVSP